MTILKTTKFSWCVIITPLCYRNEKYLKLASILVRVSTVMIKHHDQTQLGAERIHFILHLTVFHNPGKSGEELRV